MYEMLNLHIPSSANTPKLSCHDIKSNLTWLSSKLCFNMNFGDLKDDKTIQDKLQGLRNSTTKIDEMLQLTLNQDFYEKLSTKEKIDFDLFLAFALNSLYWVYLRTRGEDPNNHEIKNQIARIKDHMQRTKNRATGLLVRPTVDQAVAERVIKHGINFKDTSKSEKPPNKKRKFED